MESLKKRFGHTKTWRVCFGKNGNTLIDICGASPTNSPNAQLFCLIKSVAHVFLSKDKELTSTFCRIYDLKCPVIDWSAELTQQKKKLAAICLTCYEGHLCDSHATVFTMVMETSETSSDVDIPTRLVDGTPVVVRYPWAAVTPPSQAVTIGRHHFLPRSDVTVDVIVALIGRYQERMFNVHTNLVAIRGLERPVLQLGLGVIGKGVIPRGEGRLPKVIEGVPVHVFECSLRPTAKTLGLVHAPDGVVRPGCAIAQTHAQKLWDNPARDYATLGVLIRLERPGQPDVHFGVSAGHAFDDAMEKPVWHPTGLSYFVHKLSDSPRSLALFLQDFDRKGASDASREKVVEDILADCGLTKDAVTLPDDRIVQVGTLAYATMQDAVVSASNPARTATSMDVAYLRIDGDAKLSYPPNHVCRSSYLGDPEDVVQPMVIVVREQDGVVQVVSDNIETADELSAALGEERGQVPERISAVGATSGILRGELNYQPIVFRDFRHDRGGVRWGLLVPATRGDGMVVGDSGCWFYRMNGDRARFVGMGVANYVDEHRGYHSYHCILPAADVMAHFLQHLPALLQDTP